MKKKKLVGTFSPELQAEFDMLKREAAKGASHTDLSPIASSRLVRVFSRIVLTVISFDRIVRPEKQIPTEVEGASSLSRRSRLPTRRVHRRFLRLYPQHLSLQRFHSQGQSPPPLLALQDADSCSDTQKLVKREFHSLHLQLIDEHQQELIELMRANVAESLPAQQADFDTAHAIWFANHTAAEAAKALAGDSANAGASTVERDEMEGVVMEGDKSTTGEAVAAPAVPAERNHIFYRSLRRKLISYLLSTAAEPKKRFKFSEDMRSWLFDVITMEDSKATITIEK